MAVAETVPVIDIIGGVVADPGVELANGSFQDVAIADAIVSGMMVGDFSRSGEVLLHLVG